MSTIFVKSTANVLMYDAALTDGSSYKGKISALNAK
jgi:hypothetical protein